MPEVHIPLQHGQNESVDAKVLPQGSLLEVKNARLRKDMRYGMRYGYSYISSNPGRAIASGNYGPKRSVYVAARTSSTAGAKWYDRREDGVFTTAAPGSAIGDLGVPRRTALVRNLKYSCLACDVVYAGAYIFAVYQDADYATGVVGGVSVAIHEALGGRLVARNLVAASPAQNCKITVIGTTVIVAYATGNNINFYTVDSSSLTTATGTIVAAAAARAFTFDIAPNSASSCLLVYEQAANNIRVGTVSTAGVFTTVYNQATANPSRMSVCLGSSGNIAMVWAEGATFVAGNINYRVDTLAGAAVVASTALDTSGTVVGFPVAGTNTTNDYSFAWSNVNGTLCWSKGKASNGTIGFLIPMSKPFMGPNNACLIWTTSYSTSGQTSLFATYKLIDIESAHETFAAKKGPLCEAVAAQHAAMPGAFQTTTATNQSFIEPRRFCVTVPTVLTQPGTTAFAVLLPYAIAGGYGADLIRMDNGLYVDRLLPVNINGQLVFSGPRVREFDGTTLYETGLADGPESVALVDGGAGTATGGTVQVIVTYEWQDAGGRRHRSAPSLPQTITVAGGNDIDITISKPAFSDRTGGNGPDCGIYVVIWRTINGGTVFYMDSGAPNKIAVSACSGGSLTYSIVSLDATITSNEILYTQGERGGASGLLANDEPPPCRFMWAGNDRVIMGGLEDPSAYQFSKLIFPGEPLQFSSDDAFKGHVDAEVTAVAYMDGLPYIFTRDTIWAVPGDGPDDTGAGFFAEPRRVPSDVGCISQRSIVETAQGLLFHARDGQIWLLPRGGGAPVFFGAPVRDLFAGCLIMGGRQLPEENVVAWLCIDTSASLCFMLIYDTRAGEWMYDYTGVGVFASPRSTLDIYNGKLVIDGKIAETSAFTDDHTGSNGVSYTLVLTTGDIRPFGPNGNGRVRRVQVLGEARSTGSIQAQIQVSYDSGNVFTDDLSSVFSISTFVGNPVQLDHLLKYPRGNSPSTTYSNSYRFKIAASAVSSTVGLEGLAFNALSLEVYQERGLARQRAAMRI